MRLKVNKQRRDIGQVKQLQEVKLKYKNGTVLKSDILRAKLELLKRETTLVQDENDIQITAQKLTIIRG